MSVSHLDSTIRLKALETALEDVIWWIDEFEDRSKAKSVTIEGQTFGSLEDVENFVRGENTTSRNIGPFLDIISALELITQARLDAHTRIKFKGDIRKADMDGGINDALVEESFDRDAFEQTQVQQDWRDDDRDAFERTQVQQDWRDRSSSGR